MLAGGKATKRDREEVNGDDAAVLLNDEADWIVARNNHEPLVSREDFDKVQERMGERRYRSGSTGRKGNSPYLLSKLVYCRHCGCKMYGERATRKKNGKTYEYRKYVCSTYSTKGPSTCDSNQIQAGELEELVIDKIRDSLLSPANRKQLEQAIRLELAADTAESAPPDLVVQELAELDQQIVRAPKRIMAAPDDIAALLIEELAEMRRRRDQLAKLLSPADLADDDPDEILAAALSELDRLVDGLSDEDMTIAQEAAQRLISSVVLEFQTKKQGKRRFRQLALGTINLTSSCQDESMAGTGFEPATSRL